MDVYSVVFLLNDDFSKVVLLERSPLQKFAPNRFTGIGGLIENGESFQSGALRELAEEAGISLTDIRNFREVADMVYPDGPYYAGGYRLIYYDAQYSKADLPLCNEGNLHWVTFDQINSLDVIDDTKAVLKILVDRVFGKLIDKPITGIFLTGTSGVTDHLVLN